MKMDVNLPREEISLPAGGLWMRLPALGLGVGAVLLAVAIVAGLGQKTQLLHSYLFAYVYFLTLALGGLFFVLLQYLTRAGWSVTVRRLAEHVMATMPLFVLLFVPIAWCHHDLFHWAHGEAVAGDALLQHKSPYLNSGFFLLRAVFFLAVWTLLSWWLWRQSTRQDEEGGAAITRRLQTFSAPGMVLFAITLNYASYDWLMSLEPHWFSTIFGVYVFAGCVVAILAFLILMALRLQQDGQLRNLVTWEHYHDLGKLLFGFTVFWAYIAFSQFMLIWYGSIPEETSWYYHRWQHGWKTASIVLAAGHFGLPFLFLLLRDVKRRRWSLNLAAAWLLAMHLLDIYWLVMPSFHETFTVHWLDVVCWVAVGCLFLGTLAWRMRGTSLVPVGDPRLAESLAFENA